MPSFPGQHGYTGASKVKPIWILMKQEMTSIASVRLTKPADFDIRHFSDMLALHN